MVALTEPSAKFQETSLRCIIALHFLMTRRFLLLLDFFCGAPSNLATDSKHSKRKEKHRDLLLYVWTQWNTRKKGVLISWSVLPGHLGAARFVCTALLVCRVEMLQGSYSSGWVALMTMFRSDFVLSDLMLRQKTPIMSFVEVALMTSCSSSSLISGFLLRCFWGQPRRGDHDFNAQEYFCPAWLPVSTNGTRCEPRKDGHDRNTQDRF